LQTKEKDLKYIVYTTYSRPISIYGKEDLPYPPKKKGLILLYQTFASYLVEMRGLAPRSLHVSKQLSSCAVCILLSSGFAYKRARPFQDAKFRSRYASLASSVPHIKTRRSCACGLRNLDGSRTKRRKRNWLVCCRLLFFPNLRR